MDVNAHRIYSDKFSLYVLDLSQIDLATEEDCFWQVDEWAKLFKATTWEEIKMIADKNEYLTETSNTLCDLQTGMSGNDASIELNIILG